MRALQAVDRSDVALLVVDATEGVTAQDQRLAERIDAAGCPVVIVLNKWELLDAEARADVRCAGRPTSSTSSASRRCSSCRRSPARACTSCCPRSPAPIEQYHRRVPTRKVNEVIRAAQSAHPAPQGAKVLYATQGATDPPTFTLFANRELPPTYLRYLERKLREAFGFGATPLKLRVRRRSSDS